MPLFKLDDAFNESWWCDECGSYNDNLTYCNGCGNMSDRAYEVAGEVGLTPEEREERVRSGERTLAVITLLFFGLPLLSELLALL